MKTYMKIFAVLLICVPWVSMADNATTSYKSQKPYDDAKANEQSTANKALTALTTAATGIGGMELAMGLSQQKADKDADADMTAYIETFRCTYGDGKSVKGGATEIELPGGNDQNMMNYRAQYIALANDLKERKTSLGMKPGIESEEILDKTNVELYDDETVGITSGNYESLYRAKALNSETDQEKIDANAESAKKRVIAGAVVGGIGVVGGVVGNSLINGELGEKLNEAIKSGKAGKETKALLKTEANALKDLQKCLKNAGVQDTDKLVFDNFFPSVLSVKNINCRSELATINGKNSNSLYANNLFEDSVDADDVFEKLIESFGPSITSKMIGSTLSNEPTSAEKENAIKTLKKSIERVQKKFEDAEEQDKKDASKLGIDLSDISGFSGNGLSAVSGLFNGATDGTNPLASIMMQ